MTNTVEIPLASHSGHHHPELGVSHPKLFFLFLLHVCVNLIEYFVFLILNCITLFLLHAKILSFIHVDLCSSSSFIFCCCVIFHCMDMPQSHSPTDICLDISLFFFYVGGTAAVNVLRQGLLGLELYSWEGKMETVSLTYPREIPLSLKSQGSGWVLTCAPGGGQGHGNLQSPVISGPPRGCCSPAFWRNRLRH